MGSMTENIADKAINDTRIVKQFTNPVKEPIDSDINLKCPRPDISPYRGVSAWIPSDVASQSLDVAVSVNGGDYEED